VGQGDKLTDARLESINRGDVGLTSRDRVQGAISGGAKDSPRKTHLLRGPLTFFLVLI